MSRENLDGIRDAFHLLGVADLLWARDGEVIAREDDIVVARWRGVPDAQALDALAEAYEQARRSAPRGVAFVNVVAPVGPPGLVDTAARERILALVRRCAPGVTSVAHVVELDGLAGMAIRTFLDLIEHLASPGRVATRTFRDVPSAMAWLRDRHGGARGSLAAFDTLAA